MLLLKYLAEVAGYLTAIAIFLAGAWKFVGKRALGAVVAGALEPRFLAMDLRHKLLVRRQRGISRKVMQIYKQMPNGGGPTLPKYLEDIAKDSKDAIEELQKLTPRVRTVERFVLREIIHRKRGDLNTAKIGSDAEQLLAEEEAEEAALRDDKRRKHDHPASGGRPGNEARPEDHPPG